MRTVSFCITCKGRLHHLQQTLPVNLRSSASNERVEFILLNYTSPDNLDAWVKREMMHYIEQGRLTYYHIRGCNRFWVAHAKNLAHRLAAGELICNLDADNFIGDGFAFFLQDKLGGFPNRFIRALGVRGATGRIAFWKDDFLRLGGYDERMQFGWGYEDDDIAERAKRIGIEPFILDQKSPFLRLLSHSHTERVQYTLFKNHEESLHLHKLLSIESINQQSFIANRGHAWGAGTVIKNFDTVYTL